MPGPLSQLLLVAAGGALGAVARYAVNLLAATFLPGGFPWSTLLVNGVGGFLAGIVFVLVTANAADAPALRLFAAVGFLGAFTTFSAFTVETLALVAQGSWRTAALSVALNLGLSLLLCAVAIHEGRRLLA